ncbi:MAG: Crp/Fnr family transcriptional regulator [Chitinophagaceae bacterium]
MFPLQAHINKFVSIREKDWEEIASYFKVLYPNKKEILISEGQVCKHNYYVEDGCLRMYFIDRKGVERTVQFALEHWWLADYFSFQKQEPSAFFIQAIKKSKVWVLPYHKQEELLTKFPVMERYFRIVHQTAHAAAQVKIKLRHELSKEESFRHFTASFPEFVQSIPQYMLASYLDITPEYLSELRAKFIS